MNGIEPTPSCLPDERHDHYIIEEGIHVSDHCRQPITQIIGGPDMYINKGSTMNLTCVIKHSPEPPPAIYWLHNTEGFIHDNFCIEIE
ncbi:hypothetical protein M8J77_003541 [Diaphorina citri]|nr:hypothetical protein M8J77_003541 [Diaphorina citri]